MKNLTSFLVFLSLASGCCAKKAPSPAPEIVQAPTTQTPAEPLGSGFGDRLAGLEKPSSQVSFMPVHFATNKVDLSEADRKNLDSIAAMLKAQKVEQINLVGHCDERGSKDYNLELGFYRAKAVAMYLNLALQGPSFHISSRGKQWPVCQEHLENCWAKNRRVEIEAVIH